MHTLMPASLNALVIPERPEIGLLRQPVEAEQRSAESANSSAEAQQLEAIASRRQARRTHRVTRGASIATVMAGPLAIYTSTRGDIQRDEAVSTAVGGVVAVVLALFWERPDPDPDQFQQEPPPEP